MEKPPLLEYQASLPGAADGPWRRRIRLLGIGLVIGGTSSAGLGLFWLGTGQKPDADAWLVLAEMDGGMVAPGALIWYLARRGR